MDTSGQVIPTALTNSKSLQTALQLSAMHGLQTIESLLLEHSIAISPKLRQDGI
jgi:hypothetical protein